MIGRAEVEREVVVGFIRGQEVGDWEDIGLVVGFVVVEGALIGHIVGLEVVSCVVEVVEASLDVREILDWRSLLKESSSSDIF